MQTFMPETSFIQSLLVLDNKRLGKQRVEAKQIIDCIEGKGSLAWVNHPAVKMWKNYVNELKAYYNLALAVWADRGFKNKILQPIPFDQPYTYPPFMDDKDFHDSHKSNLLRKNPEWYNQFGWDVSNDLPYIWPVD